MDVRAFRPPEWVGSSSSFRAPHAQPCRGSQWAARVAFLPPREHLSNAGSPRAIPFICQDAYLRRRICGSEVVLLCEGHPLSHEMGRRGCVVED
eukprot:scaffold253315_cov35-Tisochrysis_lutea.AAC.5